MLKFSKFCENFANFVTKNDTKFLKYDRKCMKFMRKNTLTNYMNYSELYIVKMKPQRHFVGRDFFFFETLDLV